MKVVQDSITGSMLEITRYGGDRLTWKLYEGDCLEIMPGLENESVDMILCDLPYGTTACAWDSLIPFKPLWKEYERIIKPKGAIVLTASQPFTSALVMSNPELFKYSWMWYKNNGTGFAHAKNKPMKYHEDILVFSKGTTVHASQSDKRMNYYPQGLKPFNKKFQTRSHTDTCFSPRPSHGEYLQEFENYPGSVLEYHIEYGLHPTQKPVKLFEYLIKTYTQEGETVLDNCAGSGTTGVACQNTGRKFILIEKEPDYCEIIKKRLKENEEKNKILKPEKSVFEW